MSHPCCRMSKVTCPRSTTGFHQHANTLNRQRLRVKLTASFGPDANAISNEDRLFSGPTVQPFSQPGPCGPGNRDHKPILRPNGPTVHGFQSEEANCRPVGPEEEFFVGLVPGPRGLGWTNLWPVGPQELPNYQVHVAGTCGVTFKIRVTACSRATRVRIRARNERPFIEGKGAHLPNGPGNLPAMEGGLPINTPTL